MSATRTAAIMSRPPPPAAAEIPTIRVTDADKAEIPAVDRKNGGEERPRSKAAEPTVDGGEVEEKPVGSCEFAAFGCTITTPDHNAKRPVKHLTLLNDGVREEYKKANELVSGEDEMVLRFTKQKLVVNSIVCRDSSQLIWKIGDFANESRKAKLRLPFGYRMQAILAPYGNNDAFGDALSFYVQLLPGDYDPILRWPFDAKILFTLYDQNADVTRRLDFRYELVPNTDAINEAYVGRPFGADSNGILGVEAFVSLDQLYDGHYIAEDTIVVGVAVYD
ncbi:hypothetical protein M3Y99_00247100 [Aphelenchoides fujianensis]|nr:hypothetical protein M3Y99_00247100 [Aphelenchoides fujianensis]